MLALVLGVAAAAAWLAPAPRAACYWDSDTLKHELQGMPESQAVLTGRFDRYPPLYYEMRIDRVAAALEDPAGLSSQTHLEHLDDIGVASDRLGRCDEAIEFMARKRRLLDSLPKSEQRAEHEYRYLANLGTFHIHRWRHRIDKRSTLGTPSPAKKPRAGALPASRI